MKDVAKDKYGKLGPFLQSIYHIGKQKFSKFFSDAHALLKEPTVVIFPIKK